MAKNIFVIGECYHCGSSRRLKDKRHRKCVPCRTYAPKCLMCRFYDKEELTAEERKKIDAGTLRVNAVRCEGCKKVLVSNNRHDFEVCGCELETFVDGGSWYHRSGGKDLSKITDLSVKYADA